MSVIDAQTKQLPPVGDIKDAYVLLNLGDSVTTDHISPAGSIARISSAAKYLTARQYVLLQYIRLDYFTSGAFPFGALKLLVGLQEGHLAYKKLGVGLLVVTI